VVETLSVCRWIWPPLNTDDSHRFSKHRDAQSCCY